MKADESDRIWHALRDSTRRHLLDLMRERPRTTGELCDAVPQLSRVNVIKHLKVLEDVGLVRVRPRGRQRWNHLNVVPLQHITERWIRPFEAAWAGRLWRLRDVAERGVVEMDGDRGGGADGSQSPVRIVHIAQDIHIDADRDQVWQALTADIGQWWGSPYVISEGRLALRLDLRLGGLLWEDWGDGQGWQWAAVTGFRRHERLELRGTFMMPGAVTGSATFVLDAEESTAGQAGGTTVRFEQTALGTVSADVERDWAAGWHDLLAVRLTAWAQGDRP